MNSRLVAVASRLSSPHKGERLNAISLIEKLTGEPIGKALEPGLRRSFTGSARDQILGKLDHADSDAMISSISNDLSRADLTWQEVFTPRRTDPTIELINNCDGLLARFFSQCWDKARPLYGDLAPYRAPQGLREIPRRQLPSGASVRTTLVSRGLTMGQAPYATFRLTGWIGDEEVAFLGTFIAHGEEWIDKLAHSGRRKPISVAFFDNGDPIRLVEIRATA